MISDLPHIDSFFLCSLRLERARVQATEAFSHVELDRAIAGLQQDSHLKLL